jgi:hypothetical protein
MMMVEFEPMEWPEYPGLGAWVPFAVLNGLVAELAEVVGEDLDSGWIRAVGDPDAALHESHVQLAWLADGNLFLAIVAGYTIGSDRTIRDCPLRLVSHRWLSLNGLIMQG